MKLDKKYMQLYAVTDRKWLTGRTLEHDVEECLKGGATFIQLREKNMDQASLLKEAFIIKDLCRKYNVPFVIDDDVDAAIKCDADGIHVGQSDMEAGDVRAKIGPDKILGVSAHTVEEAVRAEKRGADYLGVGAVFSTTTKLDACDVSAETLSEICNAVSIPVVAIGGISHDNILELKGTGVDGVAVISALFAQKDIRKATEDLRKLSEEMTLSVR
ncbi:MAG: thiamine phosphate synthase [Inconstantimicrobium porci]|uniref:Thiamine-phosphate synthase n=1 Tax=Inconstantimicrobium porci TaxID=2652291 RepID=A0A7X2N0I2_9CLOT|nr:thiamine phosphate synthase [Inconstantimicrobium porci]MDD6771838.1 thiamine phosphate synthase [Inconstantimicrobium porci]MDY5910491.1 thiamine phosphate synthase [Inconstantimicrobium porci]MSR91985.1 thiamine phosphate synthase [Inconstantimicrobium porci]